MQPRLNRTKRIRRVPKVLFIDDSPAVRGAGKRISRELGIRAITAENPVHAMQIISERSKAIRRLKASLIAKRKVEERTHQKAALTRKIKKLVAARKAPYPLIVSDINMPSCHPTGVKLVSDIRKKHPKQKIVLYSDDEENAMHIQKVHADHEGKTIPWVNKLSFESENDLEHWIKQNLHLRETRRKLQKKR